jgi:dihydroorotate dehydrogenase subfamily 2
MLSQEISGIEFPNPVGLAAGFDYKALLTQFVSCLGFGFESIGTITYFPYAGNPKPRLGRLVKSKSLMVNKGFKNPGIVAVCQRLKGKRIDVPLGLSIGKTNSQKHLTQEEAVLEIVKTFKLAEKSQIAVSYYELNISCPNLYGNISFYPPTNLEQLLNAVSKLKLKKPIFIKMPVENSDAEIISMLNVVINYPIAGVIFGNLQKDKKDLAFNREEVRKFKVGSFSGKPAQKRSNELVSLSYKKFGKQLIIIGCGGVFNAKDAYEKIKLGASLVQLITGLVFEGPFLAAQINSDLVNLLKKDGYNNISEAIGAEAKN